MAAILLRARPKVPVSFEDVSIYFTKAEWRLLDLKQKVLYKRVMLDNYSHLVSLGYASSKPHLVSQLERGERPWVTEGGRVGTAAGSRTGGWTRSKKLSGRGFPGAHLHCGQQGAASEGLAQRGPQGQNPILRQQRSKGAQKRFLCQQCGKSFSRSSNLIKHRVIHSGEKPYACDECGKLFLRSLALLEHQLIHSGEKPYECGECGKTFTRSSNLVKHQIIHSGEMPFTCRECGKVFRRSFALLEHARIHSGERPYACEECGKAFRRSSNLIEHQRTHSGRKPYTCPECGKAFKGISQLIHHQRIHSSGRPFACPECGKAFRGRSGLSQHLRVHSGEKPYECSECGKAFGRRAYLFKHQAVHGGVQAPQRRGRGKGLRRGGMLLAHLRGPGGPRPQESGDSSPEPQHSQDSPKSLECEHCSQILDSKLLLIRHLRTHDNEKPHASGQWASARESKSPPPGHHPLCQSFEESDSSEGSSCILSPEKNEGRASP